MKIFISYKYTNIPHEKLHALLDPIVDFLQQRHQVYCNFYDKDAYLFDNKEVMTLALERLSESNFHLTIHDVMGNNPGSGLLIEFGAAFGKMPQLLLCKQGAFARTPSVMATETIVYKNNTDLLRIIKNYRFGPVRCKINSMDKNHNPIDPVTKEIIPKDKIYMLNQRCYNSETVRRILIDGDKKDPFNRKPIPINVYKDLKVK